MDPDMNKYDLEHATTKHPVLGFDGQQAIYHRAWELYYSPAHVETLLRRSRAYGTSSLQVAGKLLLFSGAIRFEKQHPLEGGFLRRKYRRDRRPGLPVEPPGTFHVRYLFCCCSWCRWCSEAFCSSLASARAAPTVTIRCSESSSASVRDSCTRDS